MIKIFIFKSGKLDVSRLTKDFSTLGHFNNISKSQYRKVVLPHLPHFDLRFVVAI